MTTILLDDFAVAEDDSGFTRVQIPVRITEASDSTIDIPYRFFAGTALPGIDYREISRSLSLSPGETSKTVMQDVLADVIAEADESIVLEVMPIPNVELLGGGVTQSAVVWILDDDSGDARPSLRVSDPIVREGDAGTTEARFELSLSRPAVAEIEIGYELVGGAAVAGEDFVAASGSVVIPSGGRAATVEAEILGDALVEGDETVQLVLSPPPQIAESAGGTLTILDDERALPVVFARGERVLEPDTSFERDYFSVILSEPAEETVTVDYRIVGGSADGQTDFRPVDPPRTLVFDPGETHRTVLFDHLGDTVAETDESVVVELSAPSGAVLAGGGTRAETVSWILDDDNSALPLSAHVSNPVVREGDAGTRNAVFRVELSRPAEERLEIPFSVTSTTADPGADFDASGGSVIFGPGARIASASVPIVGDREAEPVEFVELVLDTSGLIAGRVAGEATILDNDGEFRGTITLGDARTVAYLYEAGLDRDGDIDLAGLNFWIDQFEGGLTLLEISRFFLDSPEFEAAFGDPDDLSDRALVEQLYRNVLDREGETAGVEFWTGVAGLPGYGRDQLLLDFATSPENVDGSPQVEQLAYESDGNWAFLG